MLTVRKSAARMQSTTCGPNGCVTKTMCLQNGRPVPCNHKARARSYSVPTLVLASSMMLSPKASSASPLAQLARAIEMAENAPASPKVLSALATASSILHKSKSRKSPRNRKETRIEQIKTGAKSASKTAIKTAASRIMESVAS